MGHYDNLRDAEDDKFTQILKWRRKKDIKQSYAEFLKFRSTAKWTAGIQHELDSITKYYKSELYDLRHISDPDSL